MSEENKTEHPPVIPAIATAVAALSTGNIFIALGGIIGGLAPEMMTGYTQRSTGILGGAVCGLILSTALGSPDEKKDTGFFETAPIEKTFNLKAAPQQEVAQNVKTYVYAPRLTA